MSVVQLRSVDRRQEIAAEIGDQLASFEADLDHVFASGARLLSRLPEARVEAGVSRSVGQEAISQLALCLAKLGEAMDAAGGGHKRLALLGKLLGVEVRAIGDKAPHPDPFREG